jgi:hypothetical protein
MRFLRWGLSSVVLGCAALALLAGVSFATHSYTSGVAETVTVSSSGPGGNAFCPANTIKGPKIDPGSNYTNTYVTVTGYNGTSFSWALTAAGKATYDMAVVIVKGGPNSALYTYDYTGGGLDDSDSGLTAPTNPHNGKDYGISHIQFCYDPKGGGDN